MLKFCGASRGSYVVSILPPMEGDGINTDSLDKFRKKGKIKKKNGLGAERGTVVERMRNSLRRKNKGNDVGGKSFIDAYCNDDWIYEKKTNDIDIEVSEILSSEYNEMIEKRERIMQSISIDDVTQNGQPNTVLKKYDALDNLVANDDEQDHVENIEQFVNIDYICEVDEETTYNNEEGNADEILMQESQEMVASPLSCTEAEGEKYNDETIGNNNVEVKIEDACNDDSSPTIEEQSEEDEEEICDEEDNCSTDDNTSASTVEEVKSDITEIEATVCSNYSSEHEGENESNEKVKALQDDISTCSDVSFHDISRNSDSEEVSPGNDKQDISDKENKKTNEDVDSLDPKLILQISSPPLPRKSVQTPNKIILYHRRNQPRTQAMTIETSRFAAVVMHDRNKHNSAELELKKGDFVFLKSRLNSDWYHGECKGRKGLIPAAYVKMVADDDTCGDTVKAVVLCNFIARNKAEVDLSAGDLVTLTHRLNQAWYLGHTGSGQRGFVPAQHLEIISSNSEKVLPVVDVKKLMDDQKKPEEI